MLQAQIHPDKPDTTRKAGQQRIARAPTRIHSLNRRSTMRWENRRRSDNVEDRRGQNTTPVNAAMGGGIALRLLPVLLKTKGGRTLLLLGVLAFFGARMLGIDLMPLLTGGQISTSSAPAQLSAEQQQLGEVVSVILADTEDTCPHIFAAKGHPYQPPKSGLVRNDEESTRAPGPAHA